MRSPEIEGIVSGMAMGTGEKAVALWAEKCGSLIVSGQEPLRLSRRFETAHDLLSAPYMPVRSLGSIIQPFVLAMLDPGGQFCLCSTIRSQFVRDNHARLTPGFEKLPEKTHRSCLVPAGLNQNIEDVARGGREISDQLLSCSD